MGAKKDQEEIRADQKWAVCTECGCVQLSEMLPLDILYKVPHNPAIGKTWKAHHESFSNFVVKNSHNKIMEIGGGNLLIAKKVLSQKECDYSVYDKHYYDGDAEGVELKNKFLDPANYKDDNQYDTIVSSHLVEHMYNPKEYMKLFADILPVNGRVLYSFPNVSKMTEDKFTNGLNFEHTYQIDADYLEQMMTECGFKLIDREDFNDYNPMVVFEKSATFSGLGASPLERRYKHSKKIFLEFVQHHKNNAENINRQIKKYKNAYLFGCHIFSQYLLEFGVDMDLLNGIIDNDPNKQGDVLYGTNLMTYPSSVVEGAEDVVVVVQAGIYNNEITHKLLSYNKECNIIL
tara:strand:+ start:20394 stop:21434 length:1041 start_codon:yes stop_codon:yes gene_type:complete